MDSSGGLRKTSIIVATIASGEVYIIVSLSTRNDTQVVYVDPTTGALCYNGNPGVDLFKSEEQAVQFVTDGSRWQCKSLVNGRAILGYAALGGIGLLLVATKLNPTIPELPGGGCIYTVAESQWVKIPLQNTQPQGKGEAKNVLELTELDIDGKHYFCETRDITRPFPSRMPLQNPDDEFVWNKWFSMPFKSIGLPQHCVTLLQGFAERRSFGSSGQLEGVVALLARRSRLHPGTRYLARGINSCFSTGNEVECEQIVWVPKRADQSIPFNTYVWRRGTIPIWWGAELKITAAEAEIYVSDRDPYRGSAQYYQRLSKRYDTRNLDFVEGSRKKTPFVPIVCVNLLRNGEGKSECILVQHFEESLNYIRSTGALPSTRIFLINYDWHATVKFKGEAATVEGLWELLKAPTASVGISEGDYLPSRQHTKDCRGEIICSNDIAGAFCLRSHQNGVIRFNCADSLDRTNAASFFGGVQVFVEQCMRLGISLDSDWRYGSQSVNNYSDYVAPLPPGWEKRSDAVTGKTYFIDHNTRTTSWTHPCPEKPWKRFEMKFENFKRSTILSPVTQLSDLFLLAGDIHATLYTGSKAMHSQILGIFSEDAAKSKQYSAAQNLKITLQRRIKNTWIDSSRQKQLEMFLGMRLFKHLPSVSFQPLKVPSRPSGFFLKPVPSIFPSSDAGSSLLSFKRKDLVWVCHQAADVVEMFIYLREPCHVCQLLLTISHGANDSTYPSAVDVRTGRSLDTLKLVLEAANIPACGNGTNLSIPLTGPVNPEDMAITGAGARLHNGDALNPALLYDFEEVEGELDFLTRVVALTFYPSVSGQGPITLGEIEVLGVSLPWRGVFTQEGTGAKLLDLRKKIQKENNPFVSASDTDLSAGSLPDGIASTQNSSCNLSNHFVDLLSGEYISEPTSQPVAAQATHVASDDLDFLDQAIIVHHAADGKRSSSEHESSVGHAQYIRYLKAVTGPDLGRQLEFPEAIKLEIERLRLNLSAAERDRALLSVGIDPASINPNLQLEESYMRRLCRYANSIALLGQASNEDRITAMIGLEDFENNKVDFWNITGIGEICSGGTCQIRFATDAPARSLSTDSSLGSSKGASLLCSLCQRKVCKVCAAGRGALLIANSSRDSGYNGGSSHGGPVDISTNRSTTLDGIICKKCCPDIVLNALMIDYLRVLISSRRSSRADDAASIAIDQLVGSSLRDYTVKGNQKVDFRQALKLQRLLLKGEESLAEFPLASLLHSVPMAADSAPSLSLLSPIYSGSSSSYWKAPPSTSNIELAIVLGTLSDVTAVVLLVSSCGYSAANAPTVQIWGSNKIHKEERSSLGKWDVQSLISSSHEFFGPESSGMEGQEPRHLRFTFRNPVRCRIIWISLRLQRPGSHSVNLGRDLNLLSLEENPFAEPSRRASFGGSAESDPCIHAKRILVVGSSVKKEMDPTTSGSEQTNLRNWLERPPQLNRFRVPIESERLMENDLVLEQYLSPVSPTIAGFRLDAFSAIKPRVTHSPSSDADIWDTSMLIEDRHVCPPVLFMQVSALQETTHKMVIIGDYRLPEARAGTPMYFDFHRQIQTRRVSFKLLGDVASFADDPSEQDDSGYGPSLLATGLSLANRVKLYYYGDPYELGKWATSMSGV